jgi:hypothetical protein
MQDESFGNPTNVYMPLPKSNFHFPIYMTSGPCYHSDVLFARLSPPHKNDHKFPWIKVNGTDHVVFQAPIETYIFVCCERKEMWTGVLQCEAIPHIIPEGDGLSCTQMNLGNAFESIQQF